MLDEEDVDFSHDLQRIALEHLRYAAQAQLHDRRRVTSQNIAAIAVFESVFNSHSYIEPNVSSEIFPEWVGDKVQRRAVLQCVQALPYLLWVNERHGNHHQPRLALRGLNH